ncbi:Paf1-domain-containing protein [Pseudovirgaria hyperparasitica]|uniref:Paf1-domain-containing protein n=1 Tax=Pseudovirgaria hyperparasitica TaxID=470096 RepID=A0A6A6WEB9_9PEZI|nr:Paf1-domain-containing protein [Pseudovirgaria hyperparasitica]KAF2761063.1 Paf1-domain-containing protein [Pseudovirgaria hyperparasitica]
MASSSARPERVYHQDYIARVRYSNALPPPPNPPKLLDIPNTGLSSGQYTSAAYASRLAREQPLNIEADAELGMPIDLVGLPGVFDGDETVIQSMDRPPAPHPHDRPLLRPLSTLGKSSSATQGVSFLRRTEYITSAGSARHDIPKEFMRPRQVKKRRHTDSHSDDPISIIRAIYKGFDLAYPNEAYTGPDSTEKIRGAEISPEERSAWKFPVHPSKPDVKVVDSYPILPDMDAFADAPGYSVMKFVSAPVDKQDKYDRRLDTCVFRPLVDPVRQQEYEAQRAIDPSAAPPKFDYELYLPQSESVGNIKRKFNVLDPGNNDDDLYDEQTRNTDTPHFRFDKVRTYETFQHSETSGLYSEHVAVALHDAPAGSKKQKAAYIYPILNRTIIRPRRKVNRPGPSEEQEDSADVIQLTVRDLDEEEVNERERILQEKYMAATTS